MSDTLPDPAREAAIAELAQALDVDDSGSILRFGAAAQSRAQAAADAMLEGARNQDTGPAGQTLGEMLAALKGFDVTRLAGRKPGLLQRWFTRAGAEATAILQRYEGVRGQVEQIGDRLDGHRTRLLEDVERLERLYVATLDWFHALADHIAAGERVLARTDAERIPALVAATEAGDDPLAPQRLRDARAARDELERRVHDLRLTRQVAMQALPSIRLIQENDKALAAKIQSVLANTVPLWRQQLAQALAIHRMREAGRAVKAATDLTNELLTANAQTLRQGNLEARQELERGTFDLEAVKQANAALIGTIEDSLRIADEARSMRRNAEKELAACEQAIRQALTQPRATAPAR
ncbi:toxic anion resistance protein [Roseococcus sp. DSY-14]|uniref:toxic anion resistance protein n=1 Tax=Roseococcus sp. DSY-14 TaxID=3369650 RepID=UPI00387B00E4